MESRRVVAGSERDADDALCDSLCIEMTDIATLIARYIGTRTRGRRVACRLWRDSA